MPEHLRLVAIPREQADIRFARWLRVGRPRHSHIGPGLCLACGCPAGAPAHRGRRVRA